MEFGVFHELILIYFKVPTLLCAKTLMFYKSAPSQFSPVEVFELSYI